ncbi:MAG: preprotein translocase subunit SecE [Vampirovibrionales bacterium]|jgi:preprotein translocase SecE subunit|nr:preprotein translocase subunit SecE [Vampirovibrionales bacterium]
MTLELQNPPPVAMSNDASASNWFVDFFKGVQQTWYKITWPTARQLTVQVLITVAVTIFATTLVWGLDNIYRILIQTFVLGRG